MANVMRIFVVTAILSLIGNFIGFDISPIAALPGMLILFVLVILGYTFHHPRRPWR